MKRFFLTLLIACSTLGIFAQEHLSFKGIPIEGSITEFCKKLESKGFKKLGFENNKMIFEGDFTGRQATVGVATTDDGYSVYSVAVFFKPSEQWNNLVGTYNYYKSLYTRKYGEPSSCVEKNPARHKENFFLMHELSQGTVTYRSIWHVTGGSIELSIEKTVGYSYSDVGMVFIKYCDSQNIEDKIQRDLEDI